MFRWIYSRSDHSHFRVYDNANANAVMQKAITILSIEEGLSSKKREAFRTFIHTKCAPEKHFYDDDTTEGEGDELKKITFQIKVSRVEIWVQPFKMVCGTLPSNLGCSGSLLAHTIPRHPLVKKKFLSAG